MNEQLIKFIELCLMDGVVTDKEREVIFRKSKEFGVPEDECEIILEGMIQQKGGVSETLKKSNKNNTDDSKKNIEVELKTIKIIEDDFNFQNKKFNDLDLNLNSNQKKLKDEIKDLKNKNKTLKKDYNSNFLSLNKSLVNFFKIIRKEYSFRLLKSNFIINEVIEKDSFDSYLNKFGTKKVEKLSGRKDIENFGQSYTKKIETPHPLTVFFNSKKLSNVKFFEFGKEVKFYSFNYKTPKKILVVNQKKGRVNKPYSTFHYREDEMMVFLVYDTSFKTLKMKYTGTINETFKLEYIINFLGVYTGDKQDVYTYTPTFSVHIEEINLLSDLNIF